MTFFAPRVATPSVVSARLVRILEALALLSLLATREVHPAMFAVVLLVAPLTWWIARVKPDAGASRGLLPDRVLLILILTLLVGAVGVARKAGWHPVMVVAHGAPLMHSLLWFGAATWRGRSWRIGMGFVELVLAMSVSPELYLAAVFFLFVVVGSIALSTGFLDREFAAHDERLRTKALPGYFYSSSVGVAVMVFLASILLFPLLPKAREGGMGWGLGSGSSPGYSESVEIGQGTEWGKSGRDPTVVRVFVPDGDFRDWIPRGLLRSRTLAIFDGEKWEPYERPPSARSKPAEPAKHWTVTVRREALRTSYLPVPYGALETDISDGKPWLLLSKNPAGEWSYAGAWLQAVSYQVKVGRAVYYNDAPTGSVYLALPEEWNGKDERLRSLASRLFLGARSNAAKIDSVLQYFATSGFKPEYLSVPASERGGLGSIEEFLFDRRAGHCEYFASAAAVLLRMGGVPARLVAGFRVTRKAIGGVVNVRQSDAHAWVEAWDPDRGWLPMDPSPIRLRDGISAWEILQDVQDLMAAYWYRYVVAFEGSETLDDDGAFRSLWGDVKTWAGPDGPWKWDLLAVLMLSLPGLGLILVGLILIRRRMDVLPGIGNGPLYLRARSRRWDLRLRVLRWKWRARRGSPALVEVEPEWVALMHRLRYGPLKPGTPEWKRGVRALDRLLASAGRK